MSTGSANKKEDICLFIFILCACRQYYYAAQLRRLPAGQAGTLQRSARYWALGKLAKSKKSEYVRRQT